MVRLREVWSVIRKPYKHSWLARRGKLTMAIPEQEMTQLNRLLLDGPYFFKKDDEGRVSTSDLPFIVEEMIANGAVSVAIPDYGLSPSVLKRLPAPLRMQATAPVGLEFLPAPLRMRVTVIKSAEVSASCREILAPVCDELGVVFALPTSFCYRFHKDQPEDVVEAFSELIRLPTFLMGLKYQLQVFFEVKKMRDSISVLRRHCRNPVARSNLACLGGVLSTYEPLSVGSAQSVSTAQVPLIDAFEEFLTDATFRSISRQSHSLGFPGQVRQSALRLRGLFKQLLSKPRFKALLNYASKSVSVATSLPMPTTEVGEAILQHNYLPPALPVAAWLEMSRIAHERWVENCAAPANGEDHGSQQPGGHEEY